ncbi:50S ribosomal protein L29 [Trichloromonas acetexigens]|jgi:large subunit ribosomal protein L29|uniref:Large ribosomal subunit protein uL29 n=1 Tax=Trichloromonas acetexigens TaxID=38815 RepID=A0A550J7H3_9BACT|nr:50S ribosomal protein L29 [Desulfuromonas acetexigens]TRO79166.1 50S ribosomal protein L29 [Desulfuromonas acetexigens]
MKASEMVALDIEELRKKSEELSQELFNLRFQLHTGHLENTARIPQIKKDIARVNTVLRQKQG